MEDDGLLAAMERELFTTEVGEIKDLGTVMTRGLLLAEATESGFQRRRRRRVRARKRTVARLSRPAVTSEPASWAAWHSSPRAQLEGHVRHLELTLRAWTALPRVHSEMGGHPGLLRIGLNQDAAAANERIVTTIQHACGSIHGVMGHPCVRKPLGPDELVATRELALTLTSDYVDHRSLGYVPRERGLGVRGAAAAATAQQQEEKEELAAQQRALLRAAPASRKRAASASEASDGGAKRAKMESPSAAAASVRGGGGGVAAGGTPGAENARAADDAELAAIHASLDGDEFAGVAALERRSQNGGGTTPPAPEDRCSWPWAPAVPTRRVFTETLQHVHAKLRSGFIPRVGGVAIDLFRFYSELRGYGGFECVFALH